MLPDDLPRDLPGFLERFGTHRFARLVEHAVLTPPHPYRAIIHGRA